MRIEDIPDLETLDAAIAKTELSPVEKLRLKLDTILVLPQLQQPFLEWADSFWQESSPDSDRNANSLTKLQFVFSQLQLADDSFQYAFRFVTTIQTLEQEVFPPLTRDRIHVPTRSSAFRIQDVTPFSFQEAKQAIIRLTANAAEASLQIMETCCLQPAYQACFLEELTILTGESDPMVALSAFLASTVSDADAVVRALHMSSQYLPIGVTSMQPSHEFFTFINLQQVDALFPPNNWRNVITSLRVIMLAHSLQMQFMQRVTAQVTAELPFRDKLYHYLKEIIAAGNLTESDDALLAAWCDFFSQNTQSSAW